MNWARELQELGKTKAFFYVTLDPERALGLEDILPNYTIICPYKSELVYNVRDRVNCIQILVLEEHLPVKEVERIVERGTYGILQSDFVKNYINRTRHVFSDRKIHDKNKILIFCILVLKNSALIENLCKKQGWHLLAPKAKIAEKFENKISQYKLLKKIVPYPKSFIATLGEISMRGRDPVSFYDFKGGGPYLSDRGSVRAPPCVEQKETGSLPLTDALVLQFNRGHSGNSTFFIKSRKDVEQFYKKYPKREVKISEYIKGKTYTLNCVALENGEVITGSLSEQVTGLKAATNNPNTTCGNDFTSLEKLKRQQIQAIQAIAQKVGKILHKYGYRGLFGIDVIIEKGTNKVYFIELNTHQPASISFEAKLHRKIGKIPLLAYFILDHARLSTSHIGRPPIILTFPAKQIIYRNKTDRIFELKEVEQKYRGKGLLTRVKYIKPNEEIYRVQMIKYK